MSGAVVMAFDCEYTGPNPSVHDVFAVGYAVVLDGAVIRSGRASVQPRGDAYVFEPKTRKFLEQDAASSQLLERGLAGQSRHEVGKLFAETVEEVCKAAAKFGFPFVLCTDLPLDAAWVASLLPDGAGLHIDAKGEFVGGPYITDDWYRADLLTLAPWGLDEKIDKKYSLVVPAGTAHDPEDDAKAIALRFSLFLKAKKVIT